MSLHPQHPLRDLRSLHCCHNFLCLPPLPSFYFFPLIPLFLPCPYTVCTGLTRPDTTPHHRRYVHSGLERRWDCECVCRRERERDLWENVSESCTVICGSTLLAMATIWLKSDSFWTQPLALALAGLSFGWFIHPHPPLCPTLWPLALKVS